jgi:NAD(P)-dependent dehydrogenase (short-subunit alcohol dehydrogenase family)
MFDVTGQVVVVTGAASGLGLGMAEVMAENGARVVMADIDAAGLQREAARLAAAGLAVEAEPLDIGDAAQVRRAIDGAVERHGRLDTVFANAGMTSGPGYGSPVGQIENVDLELFSRALHVNLTGTFVTMQAALGT